MQNYGPTGEQAQEINKAANPGSDLNLVSFLQGGGFADKSHTDQDMLDFAKKYDPNATLVDNGNGVNRVQYDASKLPQAPKGYTQNFNLDQNIPGVSKSTAAETIRSGATNKNAVYDKNYGWMVPDSDVGEVNAAANHAADSGAWWNTVGDAISPTSPAKLAMMAVGAGLGPGLNALGGAGSFGGTLAQAIKAGQQGLSLYNLVKNMSKDPVGTAESAAANYAVKAIPNLFGGG
jgi:hypothetical protein